MKKNKYVLGVGMTKFDYSIKSSAELSMESIKRALDDSNLSPSDIDAAVVSNVETKNDGISQRHFQGVISSILKRKIPIIRTPAVCGGGGVALWNANKLGYNNVLVVGSEKIASNTSPMMTNEILSAADRYWEQDEGVNFPAGNALIAQDYFKKYQIEINDLSLIAKKNHDNAYHNPDAYFYKKKVSLESIEKSPVVASPLRLMDCSISVNGSAACIISDDKSDIKIKGSGFATDYLTPFEREDMSTLSACKISSKNAFKQSGLDPNNIDFAELHDAFTILEIIQYEDLGFAKKGEGAKLIRDKITEINGKLPVNVSGGLKAKGHPISATGLAQVVEVTKQLRNECGDRQLNSPKNGLTCNIGGVGGSVTTHIFKKC